MIVTHRRRRWLRRHQATIETAIIVAMIVGALLAYVAIAVRIAGP
jgi:hypothetical protein